MDHFALEAPGCVVLYVGSVYLNDSTGMQRPNHWKTIIALLQYIQVYTMPVWYIMVYTSTSKYKNLIPVYTGIYLDVQYSTKLSSLVSVQVVEIPDVVLCVSTRHIPPYTSIYRHMTVYDSICRDIRVSGFQMYRMLQTLMLTFLRF